MKVSFFFILLTIALWGCETTPSHNQSSPQLIDDQASPPLKDSIIQNEKALTPSSKKVTSKKDFPYQINEPDATFKLPGKLTEISGLSLSADGKYLLAVNDEKADIFYLNIENGEIEKEVDFGKNGDYEGIEMVGDKIYITKNSGTIYEVSSLDKKNISTESYNTFLNSNYNIEGLGFDGDGRLLVACKGIAGEGKKFRKKRAIYAFDLTTKKISKDPVYLISQSDIEKYVSIKSETIERLLKAFSPEDAASAFAPSGIAVHPKTKNIYILSSVGKILLILNKIGQISHFIPLDKDVHRQPEGICFAPDGTLYISNEGKGGKARIHRFSPHSN